MHLFDHVLGACERFQIDDCEDDVRQYSRKTGSYVSANEANMRACSVQCDREANSSPYFTMYTNPLTRLTECRSFTADFDPSHWSVLPSGACTHGTKAVIQTLHNKKC